MVDIPNIELFEKAVEHSMTLAPCCSAITDLAIDNCDKINLYILSYLRVYKSLPFPLNSIEDDIKYVVIGTFMLDKSSQPIHMWVDHGLVIVLNEKDKKVIKFRGIYWAIQTVPEIKPDNLNLENWDKHIGYKEYEWVLRQLMLGQQTAKFYDKFMPSFVAACKNQPMVLKWELSNMLKFGYIPKPQVFLPNRLVDRQKNLEYSLDIYVAGMRKDTTKKILVIQDDDEDDEEKHPSIKVYGFTVYQKTLKFTDDMRPGDDRLKRCDLPCMAQVFQRLTALKNATESSAFEDFTGTICGDYLVYTIAGRLYIGDRKMQFGDKEISRGATLYSVDKRQVFFYRLTRVSEEVYKRTMYSYSFRDSSVRLVNIDFTKER